MKPRHGLLELRLVGQGLLNQHQILNKVVEVREIRHIGDRVLVSILDLEVALCWQEEAWVPDKSVIWGIVEPEPIIPPKTKWYWSKRRKYLETSAWQQATAAMQAQKNYQKQSIDR